MYDRQQHIADSSPERDDALAEILATRVSNESLEEQRLLDSLLERGFTRKEAMKLLYQRAHLYENSEMRQRIDENGPMQFARWLYQHGEITP